MIAQKDGQTDGQYDFYIRYTPKLCRDIIKIPIKKFARSDVGEYAIRSNQKPFCYHSLGSPEQPTSSVIWSCSLAIDCF